MQLLKLLGVMLAASGFCFLISALAMHRGLDAQSLPLTSQLRRLSRKDQYDPEEEARRRSTPRQEADADISDTEARSLHALEVRHDIQHDVGGHGKMHVSPDAVKPKVRLFGSTNGNQPAASSRRALPPAYQYLAYPCPPVHLQTRPLPSK